MLGWSTPAGPGGLACPPGRAVEGGVLHRSGLSLLPGSRLWVLLGGGASDVPAAFLLASLCSSAIFPHPSSFWSGGQGDDMGGTSPPQAAWSSRGLGSCLPLQKEKGSPGTLGRGLRRFHQAEGRRAGSGGTGMGERHQHPPPLGPSRGAGSVSQLRGGHP